MAYDYAGNLTANIDYNYEYEYENRLVKLNR